MVELKTLTFCAFCVKFISEIAFTMACDRYNNIESLDCLTAFNQNLYLGQTGELLTTDHNVDLWDPLWYVVVFN
jgi:hypothetical protein